MTMEFMGRVILLFLQQIVLLASLQLLTGCARLLSLSQYAVAGVGAYTAARCALAWGSVPLALVLGPLAGAVTGLLIGLFCIRLDKDYVAFATLAASEVLANLFRGSTALTGGVNGLTLPAAALVVAGHPVTPAAILALHMLAAAGVVTVFFAAERSHFMHALKAQADEGILAESLGVNVILTRLHAFWIAGALAGVAGVLTLLSNRFISPGDFTTSRSVISLCLLLVAGFNKRWSFLCAALIASFVWEFLRNFREWQMIVLAIGCLIILVLQSRTRMRYA
jgi:branched-chain amino acid transport system permease protein